MKAPYYELRLSELTHGLSDGSTREITLEAATDRE